MKTKMKKGFFIRNCRATSFYSYSYYQLIDGIVYLKTGNGLIPLSTI